MSCKEETSTEYQCRDRSINDPSQHFEYNKKAENDIDDDDNGGAQLETQREDETNDNNQLWTLSAVSRGVSREKTTFGECLELGARGTGEQGTRK